MGAKATPITGLLGAYGSLRSRLFSPILQVGTIQIQRVEGDKMFLDQADGLWYLSRVSG